MLKHGLCCATKVYYYTFKGQEIIIIINIEISQYFPNIIFGVRVVKYFYIEMILK